MDNSPEPRAQDEAAVTSRVRPLAKQHAFKDLRLISTMDGGIVTASSIHIASCIPPIHSALSGLTKAPAAIRPSGGRRRTTGTHGICTASVGDGHWGRTVRCPWSSITLSLIESFSVTNNIPIQLQSSGQVEMDDLCDFLFTATRCGAVSLASKVSEVVESFLTGDPTEACPIFMKLWSHGRSLGFPGYDEELEELAFAVKRIITGGKPGEASVGFSGYKQLSAGAMQDLAKFPSPSEAVEELKFRTLQKWMTRDGMSVRSEADDIVGKAIASCLRFDLMSPDFLRDVVLHSALVDDAVLRTFGM